MGTPFGLAPKQSGHNAHAWAPPPMGRLVGRLCANGPLRICQKRLQPKGLPPLSGGGHLTRTRGDIFLQLRLPRYRSACPDPLRCFPRQARLFSLVPNLRAWKERARANPDRSIGKSSA